MRRPRVRGTVFSRRVSLGLAGVGLMFGLNGGAGRAQGVAPLKASPQYVQAAPQSPPPLYQGAPFTPRPIAPPRPVLQRPALSSPQASAQAATGACSCYYPRGHCPFPSGNCPLPQGNCAAPVPSAQWVAPSAQAY